MAKTASDTATHTSIIRAIDARKPAPIYLLYGAEPYFIDLVANHFEQNLLTEDQRDFNYTLFYGNEVTSADIVTTARQYPTFSDFRLTIVREAQAVSNWDALSLYLKNPVACSIIVLCYKSEKLDTRRKIFKEIADKGVIMQSQRLTDAGVRNWIKDYIAHHKRRIDDRSVALLSAYLGNDISKLANELDKLFIAGATDITPDVIEQNIGISKDFNNFELVSAIVARDALRANRIACYFVANPKNNSIPQTVAVLFRFFADLMLYHATTDKSDYNLRTTMHWYDARIREFRQAATFYTSGRTLYAIEQIRSLDARFKGVDRGSATDLDLLRETIYKIMH